MKFQFPYKRILLSLSSYIWANRIHSLKAMAMKVLLAYLACANEAKEGVLLTEENQMQLVLATLKPGESIPKETHANATQMTRVEKGTARIVVDGKSSDLDEGMVAWIPPNTPHVIINPSKTQMLHLSTVYSPHNIAN